MIKKWLGSVATIVIILFAPDLRFVFADTNPNLLVNPLGSTNSVSAVLANISSFLLVIAAPICGIMVVVGGFQMITAAGDPTKFSNGRKTLIYAAVGFVVVLFASSVVPLLKSILGGGS